MRRPGGYLVITDPAKARPKEWDTFTCRHCQTMVRVKPFCDPADMGGLCSCGCGLICKACVGKPCDHIEKKLARIEALHSYGVS
jgi:hypothetical protein